jgi:hypothetical protein
MDTVARTKLLAKDEMKATLATLQGIARNALPEGSFGQREEATLAIFEEAARGLLLQELSAIAARFGERILVDGVEYQEHEPGTGHYSSLNGPLDVPRSTYREVGVRNGPTIVPLDLVAGLVEGATPAMAYNVANGYARRDMRQHGEALELAHRVPPPRATLERMAKRIAKEVHEAAPRVETALRRGEMSVSPLFEVVPSEKIEGRAASWSDVRTGSPGAEVDPFGTKLATEVASSAASKLTPCMRERVLGLGHVQEPDRAAKLACAVPLSKMECRRRDASGNRGRERGTRRAPRAGGDTP